MKRSSTRGRRPLTKAMLLPLATGHVQQLQLKHHLALATLRDGHGSVEALGKLLNALFLAFHLRDIGSEREVAFYLDIERILDAYMARAETDDWTLLDVEQAQLERLLVVHDEQLAAVSTYRYLEACEQVARLVQAGGQLPIPVSAAR